MNLLLVLLECDITSRLNTSHNGIMLYPDSTSVSLITYTACCHSDYKDQYTLMKQSAYLGLLKVGLYYWHH